MTRVRVFAALAEAVRAEELNLDADDVAQVRATIAERGTDAARVVAQCTILRDGQRVDDAERVAVDDVLDVLPPFAGG